MIIDIVGRRACLSYNRVFTNRPIQLVSVSRALKECILIITKLRDIKINIADHQVQCHLQQLVQERPGTGRAQL